MKTYLCALNPSGDPLDDVTALLAPAMVMKAGEVVPAER